MEIEEYKEYLGSEDVAKQRYGIFKLLDAILEQKFGPKEEDPIDRLQDEEGYVYKLVQDFLTSSSTYEMREKLEEIAEFEEVTLPDR